MQRAARKDANHKEIAEEFENRGFVVLDVSQLKNACDIFVAKNQVTIAVEIKDGAKCPSQRKLTDGEIKFRDKWQGGGGIWFKIESISDVECLCLILFNELKEK